MPQYDWLPLTPRDAADHMAGFPHPWWIAGGWAIDLFLGKRARPHADMDIAILKGAEPALRAHFSSWDIRIAHDGGFEGWDGEPLDSSRHQFWARPSAGGPWALEFLIEDRHGDNWRYRRDPRLTLPLGEVGHTTDDGIPYLRPELVLLYKAKYAEVERNAADFEAAVSALDAGARRWLRDALARVHPNHAWLDRL